jgi:hypothetical protein
LCCDRFVPTAGLTGLFLFPAVVPQYLGKGPTSCSLTSYEYIRKGRNKERKNIEREKRTSEGKLKIITSL